MRGRDGGGRAWHAWFMTPAESHMCTETCHCSCPCVLSQAGPVSSGGAGQTHLGSISSQPLPSRDLPSPPSAVGCLPSASFLKPFSGRLWLILKMLLWLTLIIPGQRFGNKEQHTGKGNKMTHRCNVLPLTGCKRDAHFHSSVLWTDIWLVHSTSGTHKDSFSSASVPAAVIRKRHRPGGRWTGSCSPALTGWEARQARHNQPSAPDRQVTTRQPEKAALRETVTGSVENSQGCGGADGRFGTGFQRRLL